jgi:hypothetical protein
LFFAHALPEIAFDGQFEVGTKFLVQIVIQTAAAKERGEAVEADVTEFAHWVNSSSERG